MSLPAASASAASASAAPPTSAPPSPSPTALPGGGPLRLLGRQVASEFLKSWRVPAFVVGTLLFPALLYVLFGLPNADFTLPDGLTVGTYLLASFAAYGLLGIAVFSFGVGVATERGQGWIRLLRATPMPAWSFFAGKVMVAALFGAVVLLVLFAVGALFAEVRMPPLRWLLLFGTLLVGALPFSTLGFALGYWAGPNSAAPIANLVYLPLSFASGLFVPLSQLPEVLRDLAPWLPTYHYGQLVWGALGNPDDVALITGIAPSGTAIHLSWLAGTFVLFGVLAIWGYRRDQGRQYG